MPKAASIHSQFAPSTDVYPWIPDTWGQSPAPDSHVGGLSRTKSGLWHSSLEEIWLIILITFQFHAPELIHPLPRISSQWFKWHKNTQTDHDKQTEAGIHPQPRSDLWGQREHTVLVDSSSILCSASGDNDPIHILSTLGHFSLESPIHTYFNLFPGLAVTTTFFITLT